MFPGALSLCLVHARSLVLVVAVVIVVVVVVVRVGGESFSGQLQHGLDGQAAGAELMSTGEGWSAPLYDPFGVPWGPQTRPGGFPLDLSTARCQLGTRGAWMGERGPWGIGVSRRTVPRPATGSAIVGLLQLYAFRELG